MILALDKDAALYVFSSALEAQRYLEAIDVQQDAFDFCDDRGQRYCPSYTIPPKVSQCDPMGLVDIGAFKLVAEGDVDARLLKSILERAAYIEHSSVPAITITGIENLRNELRKRA